MSPFDYSLHFCAFGYYWNFGYSRAAVVMPGWQRVWRLYFSKPLKKEK